MNAGLENAAVGWLRPAATIEEAESELQTLALLAWTCHCRAMRGEFLHAQQCLESGIDSLLRLMQRFAGDGPLRRIRVRNPRRGLEALAPALAHELLAVVLGTVDMPEAQLLELAERELKPLAPALDWPEVANIRRRIRAA